LYWRKLIREFEGKTSHIVSDRERGHTHTHTQREREGGGHRQGQAQKERASGAERGTGGGRQGEAQEPTGGDCDLVIWVPIWWPAGVVN